MHDLTVLHYDHDFELIATAASVRRNGSSREAPSADGWVTFYEPVAAQPAGTAREEAWEPPYSWAEPQLRRTRGRPGAAPAAPGAARDPVGNEESDAPARCDRSTRSSVRAPDGRWSERYESSCSAEFPPRLGRAYGGRDRSLLNGANQSSNRIGAIPGGCADTSSSIPSKDMS
jgi:hypothetical protein